MPAFDQVMLLRTPGRLAAVGQVNMNMSRALRSRIVGSDVPFQSLHQGPRLRDINGDPASVLGFSGVNVVRGYRRELGFERVDLVRVLRS